MCGQISDLYFCCHLTTEKQSGPMVAGPKVSVLGMAGGPNVAPAQTGQRRLELLCQRPPRAVGLLSRTHLGAGRGFRTHEKIVLGVSRASTFILIAVKLL